MYRRDVSKARASWVVAAAVAAGLSLGAAEADRARPAAKPAPKPAAQAAKPATAVDKVVDLAKSGLSEDLILRAINKEALHADLSSADMLRLKQAGVTDKVISAMLDAPGAATSA